MYANVLKSGSFWKLIKLGTKGQIKKDPSFLSVNPLSSWCYNMFNVCFMSP